jgi:hypothetical protein
MQQDLVRSKRRLTEASVDGVHPDAAVLPQRRGRDRAKVTCAVGRHPHSNLQWFWEHSLCCSTTSVLSGLL